MGKERWGVNGRLRCLLGIGRWGLRCGIGGGGGVAIDFSL